jgi:hypothetical protein
MPALTAAAPQLASAATTARDLATRSSSATSGGGASRPPASWPPLSPSSPLSAPSSSASSPGTRTRHTLPALAATPSYGLVRAGTNGGQPLILISGAAWNPASQLLHAPGAQRSSTSTPPHPTGS